MRFIAIFLLKGHLILIKLKNYLCLKSNHLDCKLPFKKVGASLQDQEKYYDQKRKQNVFAQSIYAQEVRKDCPMYKLHYYACLWVVFSSEASFSESHMMKNLSMQRSLMHRLCLVWLGPNQRSFASSLCFLI